MFTETYNDVLDSIKKFQHAYYSMVFYHNEDTYEINRVEVTVITAQITTIKSEKVGEYIVVVRYPLSNKEYKLIDNKYNNFDMVKKFIDEFANKYIQNGKRSH